MNGHRCIACGAPADERLCPDCRAEVDARSREIVEERLRKSRGRVRQ